MPLTPLPAAPGGAEAEFAAGPFWRLLPAGMRRRWWMFRLFDVLVRHWPVRGARRGVLVVRMDGIGDVVLFRRALDHYAEALGVGRDEIIVLGCAAWAGIAADLFAGYRVMTLDEHAFARNPLYRLRMALKVRRLNAAVAVNDAYFRRALMADSLVWLSAAPTAIVSRPYVSEKTRAEYTWYLSQATRVIDTGPYPTHEAERHFRFVAALAGRAMAPEPPAISWREAAAPLPPGAAYLVLNPGSNAHGRRWPFAGFAEVAGRALDAGLRVVLVGGRDQRPGTAELAPLLARGAIDLIGATALPALLDLLKHAACVVTNDSGPAHLAIALGAPTVTIVGGGHFGCFVPYAESVRPPHARFVHEPMDCYHCFWLCRKPHVDGEAFPCVAAVTAEAVWAEVEDLLRCRNDRAEAGS